MAKLAPIYGTIEGQKVQIGYKFQCPGCGDTHHIYTNAEYCAYSRKQYNVPCCCWQFNGSVDQPTFNPSVLLRAKAYPSGKMWPSEDEIARMQKGENLSASMTPYVCHSFIREGMIQYLDDCTHELKGQTVALPDIT